MIVDPNNIVHVNATRIESDDSFVLCSHTDQRYGNYTRTISFEELCKAIAKQLVKDGVIPGGDET